MRRFENLIYWASRHYAVPGHFRRSSEELQAEGILTLVQCCRDFPEDEIFFARYFKRALYHRLRDLARFDNMNRRDGYEVDLEAAAREETRPDPSYVDLIRERAKRLYPRLSRDARILLQTLVEQPEVINEYAWRDFCRKNKLRSQGLNVKGAKRFRIKLSHIRRCLGMRSSRVREVVEEIRSVVKSEGGSQDV